MRKTQILVFGMLLLSVSIFAVWVPPTEAYQNYNGTSACSSCHPGFIKRGALHSLHVSAMTGTCTLCHVSTGDNPPLTKCVGCHVGPGLRAHHENSGSDTCYDCHNATTPARENIAPPYYSRTDVTVKDPCQAQPAPPGEDFNGDLVGLDNDGDLVYDVRDTDCSPPPTTTTTSIRPTTTTTSIRPTTTTTSVLPTTTTTSIRPTTTTSVLPTTTTTSVRPTTTTSIIPTTTSVRPTTTTSVLPTTTTSVRPTTTTSIIPTTTSVRPTPTTSVLPTTTTTSIRPTTTTSVLPTTTTTSVRPTTTTTSIRPTTTTTIQVTTEDASLTALQAPRRIYVKRSSNATFQVVVEATGTKEQMATVRLKAASPAGVSVQIDQSSITREVDNDGNDVTRFLFNATLYGTQKGRWAVNWTATITAAQNSNAANDVLTGSTQVMVINTLREAAKDLRAKLRAKIEER